MKRISLALGTIALGLAGTMAYGQAPALRPGYGQAPAPRPGYSLYGGPSESRSQPPVKHGVQSPTISPIYKVPGVPDEIDMQDQAREARRDAAVEFGMYRHQFPGSTRFWMDYDRTQLAKVRYSMDEQMFHSIHPAHDWGDGGYMYNTATAASDAQLTGQGERVITTVPVEDYRATPVNVVRQPVPAIRTVPTKPFRGAS